MPLGDRLLDQDPAAPLIDGEPGRDEQQGHNEDNGQEAAGAHWAAPYAAAAGLRNLSGRMGCDGSTQGQLQSSRRLAFSIELERRVSAAQVGNEAAQTNPLNSYNKLATFRRPA